MLRSLTVLLLAPLLFVDPAAAAPGDKAVGVNAHVPAPELVDRIAALGAKWMRVDNDWVAQQDPCSAKIVFLPPLDAAVNRAQQKGVGVFMTLAYTPPCASRGNSDATSRNDLPDPKLWAAYVRQAVAHYRPLGVRHFGLWNEPNLKGFWESSATEYVQRVVLPGLDAVKQGCADAGKNDCLSLGPDLAHVGDYDVFLEAVLKALVAARRNFDVVTHHSYLGFDVALWSGDSFVNGLDQRRFNFTRRSFVDVVKDAGLAPNGVPAFEVWISETGYQCKPAADPGQMQKQSDYAMRVIDEQLKRPWWSTTLFYEILDSGDELDGFGILRGPAPNHVEKPAYAALKARLLKEPAFQAGPKPQCSDGVDNDGDKLVDLADPGCKDGNDKDESDDPAPQRPQLVARRAPAIAVDGALGEWGGASWQSIKSPQDYVSANTPPGDANDLAARFAAQWDDNALYLAIEVTDDRQVNGEVAAELWQGDSVQVAFDIGRSGGMAYDDQDDFELGWALTAGGERGYVFQAPKGSTAKGGAFAVVRSGTRTSYEVRLPASELGLANFAAGRSAGFSLLVNDNDGQGRDGYIQWSSGIGQFKRPQEFGTLLLTGGGDGGVALDGGAADSTSGGDPDLGAGPADLVIGAAGDGPPIAPAGCACGLAAPPPRSSSPRLAWLLPLGIAAWSRHNRRGRR